MRIVLIFGLVMASLTLTTDRVDAKIKSATVFGFPLNYSGQCPVTITFAATITGDPGDVLGYQFVGDGAPATKALYGFLETSGVLTVTSELHVDAGHAGSFFRQIKVTRYVQTVGGTQAAQETFDSDKEPYSVTCIAASGASPGVGSSPSPIPTAPVYSGASPGVGSTPGPTPTALVYFTLDGVTVGYAPAPTLARLGLHPPGWARGAPTGSLPAGEVRQFEVDSDNATMMLFFDTVIEVVMVQAVANKTSSITDPYGIKLNDPLDRLIGVRGKADKVEDKSIQRGPGNSDTIDHLTVWRGLTGPVESDSTYIYGPDDGVRWEYAIKGDQVNSIRIVDCRFRGMCASSKSATTSP